MWTRGLLKKNAWENLKNYYWPALGVTFVSGILGAGNGGGGGFGGGGSSSSMQKLFENESGSGGDSTSPAVIAGVVVVFLVIFLIALAIGLGLRFFVGNVALCGRCKYFIAARNGDQDFNHLFDNYKGGNYMPTVKSMFYWFGEIYLWSLLFIIPGVIKSYEYALVPYMIAENPNIDVKRAKQISRQTMDGEKMNFCILQFSFIGWYLLGCLACGLGVLFVQPYQLATEAEFYMCMRAKMLSLGYASEEELTGGFYNGVGSGQYNEPDFSSNAYSVPNNANPSDNSGSFGKDGQIGNRFDTSDKVNLNKPPQNPNDIYNGQMPGIDDIQNPYNSDNDLNRPFR